MQLLSSTLKKEVNISNEQTKASLKFLIKYGQHYEYIFEWLGFSSNIPAVIHSSILPTTGLHIPPGVFFYGLDWILALADRIQSADLSHNYIASDLTSHISSNTVSVTSHLFLLRYVKYSSSTAGAPLKNHTLPGM